MISLASEFHNVVLSNGGVPLEVLEGVVDDQIRAKLSQGAPEQAVTLASSSPRK